MTTSWKRTDHRSMDGHDPKCATFRALPSRRGRWRWCGTVRDYGTTSCLLLRKWCLPAGASRLEPGRNQVGRHLVQVLPMEKPTNRHGRKVGFSSRTGRGQTQCRQSQCHRASRCPTAGGMSWISGHRRLHRRRLRHRLRSRHRRRIRRSQRMRKARPRKSWNSPKRIQS